MGENLSKIIYGKMGKKLNEKFGKIYPVDFENPKFLDDISKADEGMLNSIYLNLIVQLSLLSIFPILFLWEYIFIS